MPDNLRTFAKAYELDDWVKKDCPLESCFRYLQLVAPVVDAEEFRDTTSPDKILAGLAARYLADWVSTSLPRVQAGPGYAADWLVSVL
jgi:hypothetical protein